MVRLFNCPACGGDGIDTCNNPDHGFITGMGGELSRLGCPVCGHDPDHKTGNECWECKGTGIVSEEEAERIADECGKDDELEERTGLRKLHLVLKGKWFDMIDQLIKKEEYRDFKDFWVRRFFDYENATEDDLPFKEFDVVEFQHGYQPDARRIIIDFKGFDLGIGKPEWGGDGSIVFILKLGEVIYRNYKQAA